MTSMARTSLLTRLTDFFRLTSGEPSVIQLPRSSISHLTLSMFSIKSCSLLVFSPITELTCFCCSLTWAKPCNLNMITFSSEGGGPT